MNKAYYDLLEEKVRNGNYIKEDMIELIEKRRVEDKITEEARDTLLELIEVCHNPHYHEEVTQKVINAGLNARCEDLELAVFELAEMLDALMVLGGAK